MDDMNDKIEIIMRRANNDGVSCVKRHSRLKYDYSLEDHLIEYDNHTRDTIEDLLDRLTCMSPTDLQKMIDTMGCELHLQLQELLNAWSCEFSSNHPNLEKKENEEGEDYGFWSTYISFDHYLIKEFTNGKKEKEDKKR